MAGEIQLNSTTLATESSGSITAELDTIRPNTTNGSLTLQGDSSDSGVTGLTIDSSGVVNTTTAKVTNIQATSGQSLTIKDEDGNAAITIGTDNTAASYLSLNFGSYHGGSGTLTGNTLSDYEIGSWTPTVTYGTSGGPATLTADGVYTKVGRVVTVSGIVNVSSTNLGSGQVRVGGLPFNVGTDLSSTNDEFTGSINYYTGFSSSIIPFSISVSSLNAITVNHVTSASTSGQSLTAAEMGTGQFRFTATYFAT